MKGIEFGKKGVEGLKGEGVDMMLKPGFMGYVSAFLVEVLLTFVLISKTVF